MKKSYFSLCYILFGLFMLHGVVQPNVFEAWDRIKNKVARVGWQVQYYTPYVVAPLLGALVGKLFHESIGIACIGGYAGYTTLSGMHKVYTLKKKYERKEYSQEGWHKGLSQTDIFYFARWRQCNEGDGMYWTTAWQINEDLKRVKDQFLKDLYAGKFVVINAQGQRIPSPNPEHVFTAIRAELQELSKDKQMLALLTDVYYAFSQPEEFHPDVSYKRLLWPNYNAASRLYIELDVMMKRLEKLLDVVAELRAIVGGHGWPKVIR